MLSDLCDVYNRFVFNFFFEVLCFVKFFLYFMSVCVYNFAEFIRREPVQLSFSMLYQYILYSITMFKFFSYIANNVDYSEGEKYLLFYFFLLV